VDTPCDEIEMKLFYASTTIIISNGKLAPFWDSQCLNRTKPKDIFLLIYEASTRRDGKSVKPSSTTLQLGKSKWTPNSPCNTSISTSGFG
jgi:hypothetical protein